MISEEMKEREARDLTHIGRDCAQQHQDEFRGLYVQTLRDMGAADPAVPCAVVMREAVKRMRVAHPDFKPMYDAAYFSSRGAV